MTDITKEAIEARVKSLNALAYHIQVPAMPDSVDVLGLEEACLMLRALSTRVAELEKELDRLQNAHKGLGKNSASNIDYWSSLALSREGDFERGRLQGLDDAAALVRSRKTVLEVGDELARKIEALKQESGQ